MWNANHLSSQLSFVKGSAVDLFFRVHHVVLVEVNHFCSCGDVSDLACTHLLKVALLVRLTTSCSYAICLESLIDAYDALGSLILILRDGSLSAATSRCMMKIYQP